MCAGTSPRAAPSAERWPWLRLISYGMLDLRSPRQHSRLRSSAVLRCARGLQGDLVVTTETCPQRRILQAKGAPTRADLHMACTTKYVNKVRFKTKCFTFLFILRKTTSRQKTTWYAVPLRAEVSPESKTEDDAVLSIHTFAEQLTTLPSDLLKTVLEWVPKPCCGRNVD